MENILIVKALNESDKAINNSTKYDNNTIYSNMDYICDKPGMYLTFGFPQSDIFFCLMFGISIYLVRFHS